MNWCILSIWRYVMSWVFDVVVISAINHHNSDFFLSKGKKSNQRVHLGPVCSDLLHKNNFASFSFFWPTKHFCNKKPSHFQPLFLRKPWTLLPRRLRIRSDGFLILDLLWNETLSWNMALITFTCINYRLRSYYYTFSW